MLSIGLVSTGQEHYYLELSREDYYTDSGEPEGRWWGRGAKELGLSGEVRREDLSTCFQGFSPRGSRLVRNAGSKTRRTGFDLTFNAPKSVSVLWGLTENPRVRALIETLHHQAIEASLRYLEEEASFVRLGRDGVDRKRAKLVVATFEHSSARLVSEEQRVPDPHLHTHALVLNAGLTENGVSGTLDSKELFHHKMTAGVLYRAELFKGLKQELGLSVERSARFFEVAGIPEQLLEEFSKRRRVIEESLRERREDGPVVAAEAAKRTRVSKPTVDREWFFREWRRTGRELGFRLDELRLSSLGGVSPTVRGEGEWVEQAIPKALAALTERQSHFAKRELVRALGDELEGAGLGVEVIRNAAAQALQSQELVSVGTASNELRFTTQAMLRLERRMLQEAAGLRRRAHHVSPLVRSEVLTSYKTLSGEQREAFEALTEGRDLTLVRGLAGTGKTFLMQAAREAWEQDGYQVHGLALAASAAQNLEAGAGIESETVHRFLWRLEVGERELTEKTVVVLDEASMVGTRQMAELVRRAHEARAKLVLLGDDRQLQAIEAGAPFTSMAKRFGAVELNDIRRQRSEWARDAVVQFSKGEAEKALRSFRERGLVRLHETRHDAIRELAAEYLVRSAEVGFAEVATLTGTCSEAEKVNLAVQRMRRRAGALGGASARLSGVEFFTCDRVLFRKNSNRLGLLNGDRGSVVHIDEETVTVELDSGRRVSFLVRDAELVKPQLGYASTTHGMQGQTVEHCLVLVGGSMQDREASYVQASRAREESLLFVDRVHAGGEFRGLVRAMERSRQKELALDVKEGVANQELDAPRLRQVRG